MYTHIKSVQILISLLKQYNIRHIVISPGTRNTALTHSVETDDFFTCYSIVDERSAGFFALGIAEALDVPVCVSCTAATATCNYLPAMKEAYEKHLQLVALTSDQNPYEMFHMEDQCIDQVDMFHGFVNLAIDIPKVMNDADYWYANRRMNEAFQALNHHKKGPVQINYHMSYGLQEISTYDVKELPVTRKIHLHTEAIDFSDLSTLLANKKRILIVGGSDYCKDDCVRKALRAFLSKYNAVAIADTYANVFDEKTKRIINPRGLGDSITSDYVKMLTPDLIISFGNIYYSTVKYFLPQYSKSCEHWQISIDGILNDGYHCLTNVFECRPEYFFDGCSKVFNGKNDDVYAKLWSARMARHSFPELGFSNMAVTKAFCSVIPDGSIFHTTVLDSIRMSNYVDMPSHVRCFANIGADGIDGALSTFLGQATSEDSLSFLLIGDLSIMYDMNALLQDIPSNVRILVINNYAGAEFHKNFGLERIPTLNLHVAAGHSVTVGNCCVDGRFEYMSSANMNELADKLTTFISPDGGPKLLEVFTSAPDDAAILKKYWSVNRVDMPGLKGQITRKVKNLGHKILRR